MNFDAKQFYLSAEGRPNRQQWWLRLIVPLIVIGIVLNVIGSALGTYNPKTGGCLLSGLFGLAALIPSILVDIKRWHDRDKSGWWMPILFVPIIGAIWLFLAGTPGPNRFGGPVMD
jgi:uncharacterized membrane protein YhaH (DUF805 family)